MFLILVQFWLCGLWTFSAECIEGMARNLACWFILTPFRGVDFVHLCIILTLWNWSILGVWGIFWRTHGRNCMKCVDVFWPPSELVRFWSRFVAFHNFLKIVTWLNQTNDKIILTVIRSNRHNHGVKKSQACNPDFVFESKRGKSMSRWSRGIFPMLCIKFCLISEHVDTKPEYFFFSDI